MSTWSIDSLPSMGPQEQNEETQELVKQSLSELAGKTAKSVVVILTQPDLSSKHLRSLGFRAVKSAWHYSPDFFRTRSCEGNVRAIIVVQVGLEMTDQCISCIDALSRNSSSPAIIMVLVVPDDILPTTQSFEKNAQQTFAWGDHMRRAQEQCFDSGADDVITLRHSEKLLDNRLWEAVHRAEINARKLEGMEQALSDMQNKASVEVKRVKELASRQMQVAWKEVMWNLPGTTLSHIPIVDSSIEERQPQASDLGGVAEYNFTCKLGRGAFGTVLHAVKKENGEQRFFAIKIIKKAVVQSVGELFALDQEIATMMHLSSHPNIARAHHVLHTAGSIYFIMDYAGALNLHKFCQVELSKTGEKALPVPVVEKFIQQFAMAVAHMHMSMICHRDLKPTNCIVSDTPERKLSVIDFGLAAVLCGKNEMLTQCCGSLPFCAPEVLRQEYDTTGYNPFAADVWSLAGNFIELAFGPYSLERMLGWVPQPPTVQRKMCEELEKLPQKWASAPNTRIEGLNTLIGNMLRMNASSRLSMEEVLGHEHGLGLTIPRAPPRASRRFTLNKAAMIPVTRALGARAVDDGVERPSNTKSLFERIHGVATITKAVNEMLDNLSDTPTKFVFQRHENCIPAMRTLYVEALTALYQADHQDSSALAKIVKEVKEAMFPWAFSDSNFDDFVKFYDRALSKIGICETYKKEAVERFRSLRVIATMVFHCGNEEGRSFCARSTVDSHHKQEGKEVKDMAQVIHHALQQQQQLFEGLSILSANEDASDESVSVVRVSQTWYCNPDADIEDRSPVRLCDSRLSFEQAAELVEHIVIAVEDSKLFSHAEVTDLDFAMRWDLEKYRLHLALQEIRVMRAEAARSHKDGESSCRRTGCFWALDPALWFSVLLHLQASLAPNTPEDRRSNNAHCFGRIGGILAAGCEAPADPVANSRRSQDGHRAEFAKRLRAVEGRKRGFTHEDIDQMLDHLPTACRDAQLPDAMSEKVTEAISAMRPFILRYVEESPF